MEGPYKEGRCLKKMNKKEAERKIGPRYRCLNCGRIWRSREIMVICPICRSKPVRIKEGVDIKEVVKKLKGGEKIEQNRIQKNNLGITKRL